MWHESKVQNYPAVTNSYASNMSKTIFLIAMHSSEVLKEEENKKVLLWFQGATR